MVEEIITALSRIRWLFVIARNSSFTYKGQSVDVKAGRAGTRRPVCGGRLSPKGGPAGAYHQPVIDAITGTHLWADRFDGSLEDVFELQDRVALSVAGVIEPTLEAAEVRRSANRPTNDLTAYDLYLRALPHFESWEKDRSIQSLDLLTQAINRDPYYGPAIALAAHCHLHLESNGWAGNPETNRRQGIELARRALRVAGDDPNVLGHIAFVLGFLGEDIQLSLDLIDRCLALNPSFARGWFWSGALRVYAGLHDLALEHFETSLQLSPRERKARYLNRIGMAHFFTHRFHDAASKFLASLEEIPTWATPYRFLASCYAHMGRIDEARDIAKRLRAFTSVVMRSDLPFRKLEDRELFLSGLRMAMGEAI